MINARTAKEITEKNDKNLLYNNIISIIDEYIKLSAKHGYDFLYVYIKKDWIIEKVFSFLFPLKKESFSQEIYLTKEEYYKFWRDDYEKVRKYYEDVGFSVSLIGDFLYGDYEGLYFEWKEIK